MALKFISAANAQSSSVSMPSHKAGDLIVVYTLNRSSTIPSVASGFTNIYGDGVSNLADRRAYKIATSSSETSGTWTNAEFIIVAVYRGASSVWYSDPSGSMSGGPTSQIQYGSFNTGASNRWWLRMGAHSSATNQTSNLIGGTLRSGDATRGLLFDSNTGVASASAGNQSVNSSGFYISTNLYIAPATDAPPTVALDTAHGSIVSTATPELLFTGSDSHDDDIKYEIEIKNSSGTVIVSSTSDSAGFVNKINGGDTSPFTSTQQIGYTPQTGLSYGTYTWRVRGSDPSGSNTWGGWTSYRSFVYPEPEVFKGNLIFFF